MVTNEKIIENVLGYNTDTLDELINQARIDEQTKIKKREETQYESMNLILISCNEIKNLLEKKEKIQFDWAYDVKEQLSEIETEANSWIENIKK